MSFPHHSLPVIHNPYHRGEGQKKGEIDRPGNRRDPGQTTAGDEDGRAQDPTHDARCAGFGRALRATGASQLVI